MNDKERRKDEREMLLREYKHIGYLGEVITREGAFGLLVRGVSQIDDLLGSALSKHEKWAIVRDLARTLDDKIRLSFALGVICEETYAIMRALNRFRNEVSHEWNAVVDEKTVKTFMTSLPKRVVKVNRETIVLVEGYAKKSGGKLSQPWLDELTMVVAAATMVVGGKWVFSDPDVPVTTRKRRSKKQLDATLSRLRESKTAPFLKMENSDEAESAT